MTAKQKKISLLLVSVIGLSACAGPGLRTGGSSSLLTGSAGGGTSVNANKSLEHCASPLGTLAVSDGRFGGSSSVTTVEPLLRLAVQQSNCFVITSIGNARTNDILNQITDQQRNSGEYRVGSKQHKGQRVAADYFLDPQVIVNNEATSGGGGGAALGSLLGGTAGMVIGGLSAVTQSTTTDVALTLTDIRSTVQVAISQGSATANNMFGGAGIGGWGGLMGGAAGVGAFTRTPEGQAVAAAFFDAYNNMVQALKNYRAQEVKGGMGRGGQLKVGD